MKGITTTGFEFDIDEHVYNDMRLLDALTELDEFEDEESAGQAVLVMSRVATLLLGKKQKEALYKHIESKEGRVEMDKFITEMTEILTINKESKN